jgi:hypothetical protein
MQWLGRGGRDAALYRDIFSHFKENLNFFVHTIFFFFFGSSDDDHDGEFAPSLFDDAVWVPHILLPQAPLPVVQPQHELRSSVFIGPLPPPVFPMFGGEVPSFIRPNKKGVPRNIPIAGRVSRKESCPANHALPGLRE